MRAIAVAMLLAIPAAALAQTPRDIAHQVWPFEPPASANRAPGTAPVASFTPRDLARLTWPEGAPVSNLRAPDSAYVSAFNGAAIEGLRGAPPPASLGMAKRDTFLTVAR